MSGPALSDRTRRILATLVRSYIETGEPVSSATLAHKAGLNLSSATVRNVLAQLEEMGYVWQPHTSAGRVPTDAGYRCYVDMLLDSRRSTKDVSAVEARLRQEAGDDPLMDDLLSSTSHVLSEASKGVGFAIAPPNAEALFQRIEFVPLSGSRILVVMVASGNQVSQKTVDIGEAVNTSELVQAANFLNSEFSGRKLDEVRAGVVERLKEERSLYDQLLGLALRLASSTFENLDRPTSVYVDGATTLLEEVVQASGISAATLKALWRMVEEKQRLVRMLTEYIDGPGLTVVIGTEHSDPELRPFSLIAATYFDGRSTGTVGIIGPTRMRYSKAISAVDIAALAVARVLRDTN
ncbi:MAG TPA: heat-inducible transcriptional repressor HrcA [Vicinamibacterales bacterium]|nr:heat-inducible transcriptional repressor HrcA [Vicinamibacterales bacterium]